MGVYVVSDIPKFYFDNLERTNLGFPSEWKFNNIKISFRYGRLIISIDNEQRLETGRFWIPDDLTGYLSDEDLKKILEYHDLLK